MSDAEAAIDLLRGQLRAGRRRAGEGIAFGRARSVLADRPRSAGVASAAGARLPRR